MGLVIDVNIAENAPVMFFEPPLISRVGLGGISQIPKFSKCLSPWPSISPAPVVSETSEYAGNASNESNDDMSVDSFTNFSEGSLEHNQVVHSPSFQSSSSFF